MNALRITAVLAAVGFAAGTAGAQGKCDINQGSPFQLNSAKIYLNRALSPSGKPDERPKHLKSAVQVLTEKADKIGNPVGRNWLLGKTLVAWLQQPNASTTMKRGDVGYSENPAGAVDLLAAADSAFDVVEQAKPECVDSVTVYRRLPWSKIINRAAEAANADQLDSAEYYAKQSLVIYDKGPHAYNVLASVATKKNDVQAARAALKKTIETSGTDTSYRKLRQTSMYNLAVLTQNVAENTEGPEKAALTKESADLFEAYTKEVPDDPNAKTALARLRGEAGDTAAMTSIYADMLRDPTKFTDIQLFEAGSNAARANRNQDAVKLLEAGLKKNPYYRDALFNLATTYFQLKQPEPMAPVVKRLVEVDPNNPDNWRLYAGLFQLKQNSAKGAQKKAATDTLLKYLQRSETMPVRVTFNQFTHNGGKHSLAGSVENRGDKALNNVALKIEFLDQSGSVVASQTAQVGTVAPKGSQSFTVEANQQGIVAFRYAPIPTS